MNSSIVDAGAIVAPGQRHMRRPPAPTNAPARCVYPFSRANIVCFSAWISVLRKSMASAAADKPIPSKTVSVASRAKHLKPCQIRSRVTKMR